MEHLYQATINCQTGVDGDEDFQIPHTEWIDVIAENMTLAQKLAETEAENLVSEGKYESAEVESLEIIQDVVE